MKKSLLAALVSAFLGLMSMNALAGNWYGTGDNYGSGWRQSGNNLYGTGDNYGSGWRYGN